MRSKQSREGIFEGNKQIIMERKGLEASEKNEADQSGARISERSGAKRAVHR